MKKKGFTLIELMVVVALIGLLSVIVAVVIWGQREKASVSSALASMKSAHSIALLCVNDSSNLNSPVSGIPGTTPVCSTVTSVWPQLSRGWSYVDPVQTAVSTGNFLFTAMNVGQTKKITCTIDSCALSDVSPPSPISPPAPPPPES